MSTQVLLKSILGIALFFTLFFITAVWFDFLDSVFFIKMTLSCAALLIFLGVVFYVKYWYSSSEKEVNKKDYFAN